MSNVFDTLYSPPTGDTSKPAGTPAAPAASTQNVFDDLYMGGDTASPSKPRLGLSVSPTHSPFEAMNPKPAQETPAGKTRFKDYLLAAPKGINAIVEGVYSLANAATTGYGRLVEAIAPSLGHQYSLDEALGKMNPDSGRPSEMFSSIDDRYSADTSPGMKQKYAELHDENFLGAIKKVTTDPALATDMLIQSAPSMAGMIGIVRKAAIEGGVSAIEAAKASGITDPKRLAEIGRTAAIRAGTVADVLTNAAIEGGQSGSQAKQDVLSMTHDDLLKSTDYRELIAAGHQPDEAKKILADRVEAATTAISGAIGGGATLLTGAGAFEARIFGGKMTGGIHGGLLDAARNIGKEFVEETIQSGGDQLGQNIAEQQIVDPGIDLMKDVPAQAGAGGALGLMTGGAFHLAGEATKTRDKKPNEKAITPGKNGAPPDAGSILSGSNKPGGLPGRVQQEPVAPPVLGGHASGVSIPNVIDGGAMGVSGAESIEQTPEEIALRANARSAEHQYETPPRELLPPSPPAPPVQEPLALPPPRMMVTPEGDTASETQIFNQQAAKDLRDKALGITPDIRRIIDATKKVREEMRGAVDDLQQDKAQPPSEFDKAAGEWFKNREYNKHWDEFGRTLYELAEQAYAIGVANDEIESVLTAKGSDQDTAAKLYAIIEARRHANEIGSPDTAAPVGADEVPGESETQTGPTATEPGAAPERPAQDTESGETGKSGDTTGAAGEGSEAEGVKPNEHGVYDKDQAETVAFNSKKASAKVHLLKLSDGWIHGFESAHRQGNYRGEGSPLSKAHSKTYATRNEALIAALNKILKANTGLTKDANTPEAQRTEAQKIIDWAKLEIEKAGGKVETAATDEKPPVQETAPSTTDEQSGKVDRPEMVSTGEQLYSKSGRALAPVPNIEATTDRKSHNAIKKLNAWLLDEAKKEAEATGQKFVSTLLKAINLSNVSQSDRDTLNDVLFGDPKGPTAESRKKPETQSADADAAPKQNEQDKSAAEKRRRALLKDLHGYLTNLPDMLASAKLNELTSFKVAAFNQIGGWINDEIENASGNKQNESDLNALLKDGKPDPAIFDDEFYKAVYDESKKQAIKSEKDAAKSKQEGAIKQALTDAIMATQGMPIEEAVNFRKGWSHALNGGTQSNIPPGGNWVQSGYDAARAWMKGPGKDIYKAPRQEKMEGTGDQLRRIQDGTKDLLDHLDKDIDKALESIYQATSRIRLLPDELIPQDATPGTRRYLDALRGNITPFKEWFGAKQGGSRGRGKWYKRATSFSQAIHDFVKEAEVQNLAVVKQSAEEYADIVQTLAEALAGQKSVSTAVAAFEAEINAGSKNDGRWVKKSEYGDKLRGISRRYLGTFESGTFLVQDLIRNEARPYEEGGNRKTPLTRPRFDRVERQEFEDYRKGGNVTAADLKDTFGFADITFGDYVTAQQRQDHVNYAYDAFHDLAQTLGISPKDVSFGGKLHLAFGALGRGKAAAHYDPNQPHPNGGIVPAINLTNTKGDGTVAHEWIHALDYALRERAGDRLGRITDFINGIVNQMSYVFPDSEAIAKRVDDFLAHGTYYPHLGKRSKPVDHARYYLESQLSHPKPKKTAYLTDAETLDDGAKGDNRYWSKAEELLARAGEAYVFDVMDGTNTYLVTDWVSDGNIAAPKYRGRPYPAGDERSNIVQLYRAMFENIEWDKDGPKVKAGWKPMYQQMTMEYQERIRHAIDSLDTRWQEIQDAKQDAADQAKLSAQQQDAERKAKIAAEELARQEAIKAQLAEQEAGGADVVSEIGAMSDDDLDGLVDSVIAQKDEAAQEETRKQDGRYKVEVQADNTGTWAGNGLSFDTKEDAEAYAADLAVRWTSVREWRVVDTQAVQEAPRVVIDKPPPGGWTDADKVPSKKPPTQSEQTFAAWWDTAGYGPRQDIAQDSEIGKMRNVVHRISGSKWSELSPGEQSSMYKTASSAQPTTQGDPTLAGLAADFAKLGVTGIDEALKGIVELFGGNKIKSFPAGFDKEAYEKAKPHFQAALDAVIKAGQTLKTFVDLIVSRMGAGVKPYLIQFLKEVRDGDKKVPANNDRIVEGSKQVADQVEQAIKFGRQLSWQDLFSMADKAFNGTQAEGAYSVKDAYDAMEMGVNQYLLNHKYAINKSVTVGAANEVLRQLDGILSKLPTQTKRTAEQDEFQQFSTPPTYSYVAAWLANVAQGEQMLEPSAGIGSLTTFPTANGANVVVNELSPRRAELLRALGFQHVYTENAEQLHNILPDSVKPTVVIMNPPFSATAGRMEGTRDTMVGAEHVEQALKRLEDGGRLVAIVGSGMDSKSPRFREWWKKIASEYNVRANVQVDGKGYAKYGTTFDNNFLVIDKTGKTPDPSAIITGKVDNVSDLLPLLEGIRNDRSHPRKQPAAESGSEAAAETDRGENRPGPAVRPATDGVGDTGTQTRPAGGVQDQYAGDGGKPVGGEAVTGNAVSDQGGRPGNVTASGRTDRGNTGGRRANTDNGAAQQNVSDSDGVSAAAVAGDVTVQSKEQEKSQAELTDSVFEEYKPQRLEIPGAKPHPGKLVQSAAMASVEPPAPTYTPNLPKEVITKGLLSIAQLEPVVYAGMAHNQTLPEGPRMGFFIGDGTGVGKGREIAGIILDNWRQGRKKAVWISEKSALLKDAQRDSAGVGADPKQIFALSKVKSGDAVSNKYGVLFTTYDTLKSKPRKDKKTGNVIGGGKTRMQQVIEWLGKDFDGVIAFDESHNMANAIDLKGKRGKKEASEKALAGIELQNQLPNARVVYVSATGATEVSNLAYAERLGLWGRGTSFADKQVFINQVSSGGLAAMELVAKDMKALGLYISRSLSYDGVEQERLEHTLSPEQRDIYNKLAEAWQIVLQNIHAAMEASKAGKNGAAKSAAMSAFWGSHQRFFNQVITSMQMPTVLIDIHKMLDQKYSAVLQLVNTNEAVQERQLAKMEEGDELEDLDLTPRENLMQFLKNSFPTQQYEEYVDDDGNKRTRPVVDSQGNPVRNKEAVAMREKLLNELATIRVPHGPLEMILNEFGPDAVAEVTGRSRRVVRIKDFHGNEKTEIQPRGHSHNEADSNAFMEAKKRILVFSDAGGTGRSYHADLTRDNQQRRVHYLVQAGWRADKAVQGFGRTHRTNQASGPVYKLVTTDLKAQKRFISSIARRLDQLGALTRGQRQTGSQGLFKATDSLETQYAYDALRRFLSDLHHGAIEGMSFVVVTKEMGFDKLLDENGALIEKNLPDMPQFLNRLLSLQIERMNEVFDQFFMRLEENVENAIANGTFDAGLETLRADSVKKMGEQTVYTDPRTDAKTKYVELETHIPRRVMNFDTMLKAGQDRYDTVPLFFGINKHSGHINAFYAGTNITKSDGSIVERYRSVAPASSQQIEKSHVNEQRYEIITDLKRAKELWDKQADETPKTTVSNKHMITGAILPIWDRLIGDTKIVRTQTDEGERMIGRLIAQKDLSSTLRNLGATATKPNLTPAQAISKVMDEDYVLTLANGWRIKRSTVSNDQRIELLGPGYNDMGQLEDDGVMFERIQYQGRWFIPTGDNAVSVYSKITQYRPVVSAEPRVAPSESSMFDLNTGRSERGYNETSSTTQEIPRAPEETQGKIETLRREVEKLVGGKPIPASAFTHVGVPDKFAGVARAVQHIFGKEVVFFRNSRPDLANFNGLVTTSAADTIFINIDSPRPFVYTTGHELLHLLRYEHPDIYNRLYRMAEERMRPEEAAKFGKWLTGRREKQGATTAQDDLIHEEMIANFMGDNFARPEFWSELAEREPTIFQRLVTFVQRFLDRILSNRDQLIGGYNSDDYFRDIQAMRDAAATALAEYASRKDAEQFSGDDSAKLSMDREPTRSDLEQKWLNLNGDIAFMEKLIRNPEVYLLEEGGKRAPSPDGQYRVRMTALAGEERTGTIEDVKAWYVEAVMRRNNIEQQLYGVKPGESARFELEGQDAAAPNLMDTYRDHARKILNRVEDALHPLGQLPDREQYLTGRYKALGVIGRVDEIAGGIRDTFSNASEEDQTAAYEYFTTRNGSPDAIQDPAIREAAVQTKNYIESVGDELVNRALLSEETREANRGAYLPRVYLKHLLSEQDWKLLGSGKKPSDMGYLKQRKDIPEEVRRVILGEITDPAYLSSLAIAKPMRDMALLDWLEGISQNENWVMPKAVVEFDGKRVTPQYLKAEADRLRAQSRHYKDANDAARAVEIATRMDAAADEVLGDLQGSHTDYSQIPNTARYGRLRGLWVRNEIYDDIMGSYDITPDNPGWFQNLFGYGGVGTKVTQIWKTTKVALNPPAQIRNFVSNMVLLQLSGVPLHRVPSRVIQAAREIADNGQYWQIAKKYGVTESTFSAHELFRIKRDLLDLEERERGLSAIGKMHRVAAIVTDAASDVYQWSEALNKTAKIIDAMERQNMTEDQAALEAQKWLFDYSLVPKSVRYARNAPVGMPFLTFYYKVLPRMLEVILFHPQRLLPWVGVLYGLPYIFAAMMGYDKDDWDKLKQALPDWMRDKDDAMLLPYKDENGRFAVMDLGYFLPWSMYTDMIKNVSKGKFGEAVNSTGLFGGPIPSLISAVTTGKDPFTDRDIIKAGDPPSRKALSVMNYLWTMAAPPFMTDSGVMGHAIRSVTGETDKFGNPRNDIGETAGRAFGVNIYRVNPQQARAGNIKRMLAELRDVDRAMISRLQDHSLSQSQRQSIVEEYRAEKIRRAEQIEKYISESNAN